MILHMLDGRCPGDSYGRGFGDRSGNGRGGGSGLSNGTGYGAGDDGPYAHDADHTIEVVAPCVAQMYLLAQVLEDP